MLLIQHTAGIQGNSCILPVVSAVLAILMACPAALAESDEESRFFESRIRPVLVEHCYQCHSAEAAANQKLKGGLQLDTRQGLLQGGDLGPAIVPGQPQDSLLIQAMRQESGLAMPPDGMLPENVIADMERWIATGAVDPRQESSGSIHALGNSEGAASHWAFRKPVLHPLPQVKDGSWPRVEADYFVLARLEERGLRPVPVADRRQLLRRVTIDLIGLPPTLEEMEGFLQDESPEAVDRVLDRLLSSPHYGERWGRFWLDVARYADDKALAYHNPWPHAYRYRDWVVDALNRDMPYDQFLAVQLAGDLIPEFAEEYSELAALGFQGLGAIYHKGNFPKQVMADELDDRIDTLTRGLLGLTVACARCHDHKYDPVSTSDYYSLAAAYNDAKWVELPMAAPEDVERRKSWEVQRKEQDKLRGEWLTRARQDAGSRELGKLERYLIAASRGHAVPSAAYSDLYATYVTRCRLLIDGADLTTLSPPLRTWVATVRTIRQASGELQSEQEPTELPQSLQIATRDLVTAAERALLAHHQKQNLSAEDTLLLQQLWIAEAAIFHVAENQIDELFDDSQRSELKSLNDRLAELDAAAPLDPPKAHGVAGGGMSLRVHIRGNVERLGDEAPPGFLPVLALPQSVGHTAESSFTRLDLARAICTADNPLTARVIVNRIWQQYFGQGIVSSASNFGVLGTAPTHPELLDTLAVRFMQSGWSLKWLHRALIRSATYQLSSRSDRTLDGDLTELHGQLDPANRLLWKFSARRLEFESLRDSLLAVAGQLDRTIGGPAAGRAEAGHSRRTLYSTISRREPDRMLVTFDFPDPNVTAERRNVTTVPQQQLFALNSSFMHDAAAALAARAASAADDPQSRIQRLYQWILIRNPNAEELKLASEFILAVSSPESTSRLSAEGMATSSDNETVSDNEQVWIQLAHALLATNEFVWVD